MMYVACGRRMLCVVPSAHPGANFERRTATPARGQCSALFKGVNTRHSNAMRAAHRVPPTAALAIACIACAHTCMNRTQIHTLHHSSRTRVLPNLTMRHFTTRTQQTSQTLPTLSTHSPPHTAPHKAPGNPTMSLSTTYDEPAASSLRVPQLATTPHATLAHSKSHLQHRTAFLPNILFYLTPNRTNSASPPQ